ncbi:hypothetical protein ACQJBY_043387 [Aegilops geniculata]
MAPPPGAAAVESSPSHGSPTCGRPTSSASSAIPPKITPTTTSTTTVTRSSTAATASPTLARSLSRARPRGPSRCTSCSPIGPTKMRVMFVCADAGKRAVRYGLEKEEEKGWTEAGTEVRTYEQKHMCNAPANDSQGWRDPGFVFDGLMNGLELGRRYFYKQFSVPAAADCSSSSLPTGGAGRHPERRAVLHIVRRLAGARRRAVVWRHGCRVVL